MAKKEAKKDNTLPILAHLLGLFTGFLGPLIILLAADDNLSKKHAKMSLNWQFSAMIYGIVSFILLFILIGFILLPALAVLNLVFVIIATIRASEDKLWKYPLAIPFFNVK